MFLQKFVLKWNTLARFANAKSFSTNGMLPEYAVEMACSNIRYGAGASAEVGMDLSNMKAKNVMVVTDRNLERLPPVQTVRESLGYNNIKYEIYSETRVEPTNESFQDAIDFARKGNFDAFLAVGGGSVIDTCKAANLYLCNPEADFLDFVNAPIGKGKPVPSTLKPLIAVTTTAGTGSETTGVTIFDYLPLKAKTGIASRNLRPTLGIVDPLTLLHLPNRVACYSGFDVLCHALESYTAIPFMERMPRPENPAVRPAYQGSNPISDVWSKHALTITRNNLKRAVNHPDDLEARSQMHLASAFAAIGFGNAGVHLCHGMSYPISGLVKDYVSPDYNKDQPLVPHGLSVVITAPAVFRFTAPACPERHLEAASALGADVTNAKRADAGKIVSDLLLTYMDELKIPDGISALGYNRDDIPALVKGTLPQERVTKLSPRKVEEEHLHQMFEESLTVY
uniref:Hydroxyacid-oxoacid transhydrogenase, mitochondrial n=1 Tax=Phallusia mammillata TaxID=59560 RepID=A0A6F9D5D6_9ASCI|nr:hydroxyacid-oxoacid transhydrogenase, mitochondrial [Phallusia mammillata]